MQGFTDVKTYFQQLATECPELEGRMIWGPAEELANPASRRITYPCLAIEYPTMHVRNNGTNKSARLVLGIVILDQLPREKSEIRQAGWDKCLELAMRFADRIEHDIRADLTPFLESEEYDLDYIRTDNEQDIGFRLELPVSGDYQRCYDPSQWNPAS